MRAKALTVGVCVLALAALGAMSARADDVIPAGARSGSSAILGAEDWYCGAFPPPGWHILNYFLYYRADEIKGKDGREVGVTPFVDYDVTVLAEVFRLLYVSDMTFLGASPSWQVVVPVIYKEQDSDAIDDDRGGLGDIYISAFLLGWHRPPWHMVGGLDLIAPTGEYDKDRVTNLGNNHWTFEPAFAISYIPEGPFSASVKLMYDIHTEDNDTNHLEGDQFHLDYNLGYSFGEAKQWKLGLGGYWLISTDADELDGAEVVDSEERVFSFGPSLSYQKDNWMVVLKHQIETGARNRPEGSATWLKIVYSF